MSGPLSAVRSFLLEEWNMKYGNESEIYELRRRFETCTISRDQWGHPEHLIVAYLYSRENSLEMAYEKMKDGIFRLLGAFGVDLSKEMPYHETLTVFWITAVYSFSTLRTDVDTITACTEMVALFGKHYPARFYSNERLFSDEARASFAAPDRKPDSDDELRVYSLLRPLAPKSRRAEKQV